MAAMPGVYRPYTLTDVLGTLTDQSTQQQDTAITGLGDFAETDEQATLSDSATATAQAPPTWGSSTWGAAIWG